MHAEERGHGRIRPREFEGDEPVDEVGATGTAVTLVGQAGDTQRAYQRVAILAPNMPGVVAKISAIEAKLSAKRASGGSSKR